MDALCVSAMCGASCLDDIHSSSDNLPLSLSLRLRFALLNIYLHFLKHGTNIAAYHVVFPRSKSETAFPLAVAAASKSHRAGRVALGCLAAVAISAAAACALVDLPWKGKDNDHRGPLPTAPVTASGALRGPSAWKGVGHSAAETTGESGMRMHQVNGPQAAPADPTRRRASGKVDEDVAAAAAERRSSSPTMDNSRLRELRIFRNVTLDFSESSEGGPVGGPVGFPALEESTLMFLHVFKCAGSTLRSVFERLQ